MGTLPLAEKAAAFTAQFRLGLEKTRRRRTHLGSGGARVPEKTGASLSLAANSLQLPR
jgi:hypothetical protein